MSRCIDCHWFENAPPVARTSKSCSNIGELAQTRACDNFTTKIPDGVEGPMITPKEFVTLEERKGFLGALMDEPYAVIFNEILAENFVLAQDAHLAIKTVQAQLQAQGAAIDAPAADFHRTVTRILDLVVTYRIACAVGLGRFADKIVEREIDIKFAPPRPRLPTRKG
jgi:hypothetical protein